MPVKMFKTTMMNAVMNVSFNAKMAWGALMFSHKFDKPPFRASVEIARIGNIISSPIYNHDMDCNA